MSDDEVCDCGWLIPNVRLEFENGKPQAVTVHIKCPKCGEIRSKGGLGRSLDEAHPLANART
jgi:hypothetical protein